MAGSLIGSLAVSLGLETAAFNRGAAEAETRMGKLQQRLGKIGEGITRAGVGLTASITAPFAALVASSIPAALESRQALGQVEAANRSMGQAAGFSTEQLQEQAAALQALSTFDDDEILAKVTANLLTFGNVSGEVFARAQQAAVDMSARLGSDLQGSALMLGKALNDPIKGLSALSRVGVSFTKQQQDQIKAMVAAGDTAGAQAVMLAELERQFKGSAKAMRDADPSSEMRNNWAALQETIGELALQALPPLLDRLNGLLGLFNELSPETQTMVIAAAALAAALGPVLVVLGSIVSVVSALIPLVGSAIAVTTGWAAAMAAAGSAAGGLGVLSVLAGILAPLIPIIAGVSAALAAAYLIWQNWESIGPMLSELWGSIESTLGPPLRDLIGSVSEALSSLWNGPFGEDLRVVLGMLGELLAGIIKTFGPVVVGIVKALGTVIGTVMSAIGDALNFVSALLRGDWEKAWTHAKNFVTGIVSGIKSAVGSLISSMIKGLTNFLEWAFGKLDDVEKRRQRGYEQVQRTRDLSGNVVAEPDADAMHRAWQSRQPIIGGGAVRFNGQQGNSFVDPAARDAWNGGRKTAASAKDASDSIRKSLSQIQPAVEAMIDGVAAEMAKLDQALVEPIENGATAAADRLKEMKTEVRSLLDQLFPEIKRDADHQRAIRLLEGAGLAPAVFAEARRRLQAEFEGLSTDVKALFDRLYPEREAQRQLENDFRLIGRSGRSPAEIDAAQRRLFLQQPGAQDVRMPIAGPGQIINSAGEIVEAGGMIEQSVSDVADSVENSTGRMVLSFANMARDAVGSVQSMVSRFKSGDILGAIESFADLVVQLIGGIQGMNGGAGLGGIFSFLGGSKGGGFGGFRARGGPVVPGKYYVVGENGPELAAFGSSGRIFPNMRANNDNAGSRGGIASIVPSPYFDVVVDGRAAGVAAPLASRAEYAGAARAETRSRRRAARQLPTGR